MCVQASNWSVLSSLKSLVLCLPFGVLWICLCLLYVDIVIISGVVLILLLLIIFNWVGHLHFRGLVHYHHSGIWWWSGKHGAAEAAESFTSCKQQEVIWVSHWAWVKVEHIWEVKSCLHSSTFPLTRVYLLQ